MENNIEAIPKMTALQDCPQKTIFRKDGNLYLLPGDWTYVQWKGLQGKAEGFIIVVHLSACCLVRIKHDELVEIIGEHDDFYISRIESEAH